MLAHDRQILQNQINSMFAGLAARIEAIEQRITLIEEKITPKSGKITPKGVDKSSKL